MAALNARPEFGGIPELGRQVDGDTWLTPRFILDQLGWFDLDPCAAVEHPGYVGARHAYTKDDDGLRQEWKGRVFMNPPYSNVGPWLLRPFQPFHWYYLGDDNEASRGPDGVKFPVRWLAICRGGDCRCCPTHNAKQSGGMLSLRTATKNG